MSTRRHIGKIKEVDPVREVNLYDLWTNGIIMCESHPSPPGPWCAHMEEMCAVGSTFEDDIRNVGDSPERFTVPLTPTVGLWASVLVQNMHNHGFKQVTVPLLPGTRAMEADEHYLGLLAEDEGRGAIRLMLFDWYRSEWDAFQGCRESTHGLTGGHRLLSASFHDNPSMKKVPRIPTVALAGMHSVLTTGYCKHCLALRDASADAPVV